MWRVLRFEIHRAFRTRMFRVACVASCVLVLIHFILNVYPDAVRLNILWKGLSFPTSYLPVWYAWIGFDTSISTGMVSYVYFFALFPIFAALPNAASSWQDIKSGFQIQVCTRVDRRQYFLSKYIATFLSGGFIVVLPLVLDLILCHMVLPAYLPVATDFLGVFSGDLWCNLFYSHPYIYTLLFLGIDFLYGGSYACLGLAATYLLRNAFLIELFPYIFLTVMPLFESLLPFQTYIFNTNKTVPFQFYKGFPHIYYAVEIILLLVLSMAVYLLGGRKRELYN